MSKIEEARRAGAKMNDRRHNPEKVEAGREGEEAEARRSALNLCSSSGTEATQAELRSCRSPPHWRLFISQLLFPRSSKGFPEVICTLDPTVHPYLSISQMGEQDTTWLTYLSKIRV